jgi:hypothetical protein
MRQRRYLRIQTMNHRMQGNRVIHIGIDGRIMFQNFAIEVEHANIRWTKRTERRPKPIHQHFIFANGYAQMARDSCAQAGSIQRPRRTTNIELKAIN